jgi:hypothetical protein
MTVSILCIQLAASNSFATACAYKSVQGQQGRIHLEARRFRHLPAQASALAPRFQTFPPVAPGMCPTARAGCCHMQPGLSWDRRYATLYIHPWL